MDGKIVFYIVFLFVVIIFCFYLLELNESQNKLIKQIDVEINNHIDTLAKRYLLLYRADHYGYINPKPWTSELEHFINNVLAAKFKYDREKMKAYLAPRIESVLMVPIRAAAERLKANTDFNDSMSPLEYEAYCGRLLTAQGWSSQITPGSGDQGADVIAKKNGFTLVIQCKKYSSPVGNKAVQEVAAAKQHYAGNAAAVVTNNTFTRSAEELAHSTGVLLLSHSDLIRIDALLGLSEADSRKSSDDLPGTAKMAASEMRPAISDIDAADAAILGITFQGNKFEFRGVFHDDIGSAIRAAKAGK